LTKVLTIIDTLQNRSWQSMTEILPGIVQDWTKAFQEQGHEVIIHQVEEDSTSKILASVLKSDLILFTAFNLQANQLHQIIRQKLNLEIPIGLYLHGLASVGLWPLEKWGWLQNTKAFDFFVVTSDADIHCLQKIDLKAKVFKIPFSIDDQQLEQKSRSKDLHHFIFTGRISEQKNLHTLLWGISLLNEENRNKIVLDIFGKEDHLGSPNMGKKSTAYLKTLEDLVVKLKLNSIVKFHGFLDREELNANYLSHSHTFISPSLHSDENFGMAALRSLKNGHRALLTAWGGHLEFDSFFNNQVDYLPVYKSHYGPVISPLDIKKSIEKALSNDLVHGPRKSACSHDDVSQLIALQIPKMLEPGLFQFGKLATDLAARYTQYFKNSEDQIKLSQIFENYADTWAHLFFESYGMKTSLPREKGPDFITAPWVTDEGSQFKIADPHRGEWFLSKNEEELLFEFGLRWTVKDS